MADLVVANAGSVGGTDLQISQTLNMIAAVALSAGQVVYRDATGKADLASAAVVGTAGARGIVLRSVGAGEAVTVLVEGEIEGYTITQDYDAPIFVSDTAGALGDVAGTVSVPVGNVSAATDPDGTKLIYVRFPVGN